MHFNVKEIILPRISDVQKNLCNQTENFSPNKNNLGPDNVFLEFYVFN